MAEVCYNKVYRTKASGRRYTSGRRCTSGSTGRSGTRGGQGCTGCAFWQQMTGPRADYPPRETHASVRVWGLYGGWFRRHILLAASRDPGTQDPNNKTRCVSSILIFVHSNPDKLLQHGPLLQVYISKSSIHQWQRTFRGPRSQGLPQGHSWSQCPSATRIKQPDLLS